MFRLPGVFRCQPPICQGNESRRTIFRPGQVLAWAILQLREWNDHHPTGVSTRREHGVTAIPDHTTERARRRLPRRDREVGVLNMSPAYSMLHAYANENVDKTLDNTDSFGGIQ